MVQVKCPFPFQRWRLSNAGAAVVCASCAHAYALLTAWASEVIDDCCKQCWRHFCEFSYNCLYV